MRPDQQDRERAREYGALTAPAERAERRRKQREAERRVREACRRAGLDPEEFLR